MTFKKYHFITTNNRTQSFNPLLHSLRKGNLEDIVGKGINASNRYFFFFYHNVFVPFKKLHHCVILNLLSANSFNLNQSKIVTFGKCFKIYLGKPPGQTISWISRPDYKYSLSATYKSEILIRNWRYTVDS